MDQYTSRVSMPIIDDMGPLRKVLCRTPPTLGEGMERACVLAWELQMKLDIRPIAQEDRSAVARTLAARWAADVVVAHGTVYQPHHLPGFLALHSDHVVGIITYHIAGTGCEIVTLDSLMEGAGVGTQLIEAVVEAARDAGCDRVWLITTNDNLGALRFYQKRGFHLVALYPDAVSASRRIKPEIPLLGNDRIPIRDELELELTL